MTDDIDHTMNRGALVIRSNIDREAAWQVLESKLSGCQCLSIESSHHPFFAVEFDIIVKSASTGRIGVLVNAVGGSVSTISEWPQTQRLAESKRIVFPPSMLDAETARARARRAAASRVMRKLKIGKLFTLSETRVISILWKLNWMVQLIWRGQQVRVLVDGLDGSYYVVSAGARSSRKASRDRCNRP